MLCSAGMVYVFAPTVTINASSDSRWITHAGGYKRIDSRMTCSRTGRAPMSSIVGARWPMTDATSVASVCCISGCVASSHSVQLNVNAVVSCPARNMVLHSSLSCVSDMGVSSMSRAAKNIPSKSVSSCGFRLRSMIIASITVSNVCTAFWYAASSAGSSERCKIIPSTCNSESPAKCAMMVSSARPIRSLASVCTVPNSVSATMSSVKRIITGWISTHEPGEMAANVVSA